MFAMATTSSVRISVFQWDAKDEVKHQVRRLNATRTSTLVSFANTVETREYERILYHQDVDQPFLALGWKYKVISPPIVLTKINNGDEDRPTRLRWSERVTVLKDYGFRTKEIKKYKEMLRMNIYRKFEYILEGDNASRDQKTAALRSPPPADDHANGLQIHEILPYFLEREIGLLNSDQSLALGEFLKFDALKSCHGYNLDDRRPLLHALAETRT